MTMISRLTLLSLALLNLIVRQSAVAAENHSFIPPATPLVACDPYFSIWSTGKALTDTHTTHWTGRQHRLVSLIRIDGKAYRLMGNEPTATAALKQTGLKITPTRSIYEFEGAGIGVELTFMTPALPEDIDLLSRPITYVSYKLGSLDGKEHAASIYFAASGEVTVNEGHEAVTGSQETFDNVRALKIGSKDQVILGRKGDDLRIDWGYLYVAADQDAVAMRTIGVAQRLEKEFVEGTLKESNDENSPAPGKQVAAAVVLRDAKVGDTPTERWLVVAYDDIYSIEYMRTQLRPYWRRNGLEARDLLIEAVREYPQLVERCAKFDRELTSDLARAGGKDYAQLCALAYRQCFAAGKFAADANGQPLQFSKENHSNGCIATSDVFYPMAPQFLMFGPSLAKSFLSPFMNYAASERWKFPFAPHDLGTYPKANGQVYGGGELTEDNQMPVEESGNLLILMAAIAKMEGNAGFAELYWPQLEQWAKYLKQEGFDPDNQLCTDDFAGHLAHNVNLSAKAICGLGAFSQLCEMRGDHRQAEEYRKVAEEFAARWVKEADDGDHFRLAFDKPGSWSQKYNLVWDRVLGLNLFPESVLRKEMDFYLKAQNKYGLPLDNRKEYTKLDWILWTATLTQKQEDFEALVKPVMRFLEETPDRSPMTDWYETVSGKKVGFTARPVVGGVFMRMLYEDQVWQKWAQRDQTNAKDFAPMPKPPKISMLVPAADWKPAQWRYTFDKPSDNWSGRDFNDAKWNKGKSGFGRERTPGARIGTSWETSDIWMRRKFAASKTTNLPLQLHIHYDEDAEVYINGVFAGRTRGFVTGYEQIPVTPEAQAAIKPSGNVLAVHCQQSRGGQFIDVGLAYFEPTEE